MELHQLQCFINVAETLHFGQAARNLQMSPAAIGRQIKLLEESLGTTLFVRTTRTVELTEDGASLVESARNLLEQVQEITLYFRQRKREKTVSRFRIGAIDSASAGLMPILLKDMKLSNPTTTIQLREDKTIRLLPRLLSGALDLAFVRPPEKYDKRLEFKFLFYESPVLALPIGHILAKSPSISVYQITSEPLIVPDRRVRPHSYDLTMRLFQEAGVRPNISGIADEKKTILGLVAAGLGIAIVPRWTAQVVDPCVSIVPLEVRGNSEIGQLPLAAAWLRSSRDPVRDTILNMLISNLGKYSCGA